MKKIQLFILRNCPFCIQALDWQNKILTENPHYREVPIEIIDENEQYELANSYDYYYVPSYYLDGRKLHEGVATREKIENIFAQALED
ncbi:MAG: thioredoxin family protein [Oscillospiraceae bacterium]|nr:thioredoxin family protein [Oscillospiraceae bacterium]